MWFETTRVVLTSGTGVGGSALNAFDNALRDGGIADFNLIKVSSIVPPGIPVCRLSPGSQPVRGEGLMVPTIYVEMTSAEAGERLAVAVGAGIPPADTGGAGIVFVASCVGERGEADEHVRAMVREGMRAKGLPEHRIEVAAADVVVAEPWTTVLAAAVFLDADIESTFTQAEFG